MSVNIVNRIQKQIVKDALDTPEILSDWQYDFVNDLADKEDCYELTEKQNTQLNKIGSRIAEN
jgi:hypothetical protein